MPDFSGFSGFPTQTTDFLAELAQHNERTWFEAHRDDYQRFVLEPAQAFVRALGARLQSIAPDIHVDERVNGSGVLMRIHRDTRFSKDKTPYKTNISGMFWDGAKKTESPAYGFQLEAHELGLMAGIFKFTPDDLTRYRSVVDNEHSGAALIRACEKVHAAGAYKIAGEQYKRVPAGYAPDHPRADLLRHDGLYVFAPPVAIDQLHSPDLVDLCFTHFNNMAPIYGWLVKDLGLGSSGNAALP